MKIVISDHRKTPAADKKGQDPKALTLKSDVTALVYRPGKIFTEFMARL